VGHATLSLRKLLRSDDDRQEQLAKIICALDWETLFYLRVAGTDGFGQHYRPALATRSATGVFPWSSVESVVGGADCGTVTVCP
jgi:hypothetical protein